MYTTVVEINGKKIEVYGVMFVSVAVKSKIFQNFIKNMDPRFIVQSIEIQAIDFRGAPSPENVLFLKMKADVAKENEYIVLDVIRLRDIPIKTPDGKALSALALYDYLLNKDEIK